jgi:hypothetical protein
MTDENWVAVLYPQTGALRLYPGLSVAKTHVSAATLTRYSFRSPVELQRLYAHDGLENLWRKIFEHPVWGWPKSAAGPLPTDADREPPDLSSESLARELWDLVMRVGDRVVRVSAGQASPKSHYYLNRETLAQVVDGNVTGYPKQARVIATALYDLGVTYVEEDALRKMMLRLTTSGQLKTKQEPWLIFQFYRAKMIKDGLFSRGAQDDQDSDDNQDQE